MKRRRQHESQQSPALRAAIMDALDNQLKHQDPPETRETFERLQRDDIDEEEARRLLACVIASELFDIAKTKQPFDRERFVMRLSTLPEMPWMEEP